MGLFISRLAGIEYSSLSSHCQFLTFCLPQMCLNRQCQNVSVFGVHECSAKCNGRGVSMAPLSASVIAVCLKTARSLVYIKQPCYVSVIFGVLHMFLGIVRGLCWKAQSFSFPTEKTAPEVVSPVLLWLCYSAIAPVTLPFQGAICAFPRFAVCVKGTETVWGGFSIPRHTAWFSVN